MFAKKNTCLVCTSAVLLTIGLSLISLRSLIFDCILSLECNPILFRWWKKVPIDMKTEFYLFNWTNAEDIYNKSIKPKFEQFGPYVFHQTDERCDIVWNKNGTVTYRQKKFWYYSEEESNGTLNDNITNVEAGIMGMSFISKNWNYYVRKGVFLSLSSYYPSVYKTHTVDELLFTGYPQPFLKISSAMPFFQHLKLPSWDRFGFTYSRNGSCDYDGVFNMGTGKNTVLGRLYQWNYQSQSNIFEGQCGEIKGSTGQFAPRNIQREFMEYFTPDFSRFLTFKYEKDQKVEGVLGYKFTSDNYIADNGQIYPENKCFCIGECTPSGLFNISGIKYQMPLFVSLPQFYISDPYYLNMVEGLNPGKNHESTLTVEPVTGIILKVNLKAQLNLLLQQIPGIRLFEEVPKAFIPILWLHQKFQLPKEKAFLLKLILAFPLVCLVLGILMTGGAIILLYFALKNQKGKSKKNEEIPRESEILLR